MIYMLTANLMLVGAAACAIMVIGHMGRGRAGFAPMATAMADKLRP